MNVKLKERVNTKRIKVTFISAVFLSLFIGKTFAQENQQPFDYSRTIWIVGLAMVKKIALITSAQ